MSLPPETMKLLLDFLGAVGSLLYVVGGYFLGKWRSDRGELATSREFDRLIDKLLGPLPEPSKGPLWAMGEKERKDIAHWLVEALERIGRTYRQALLERSARRSMWIGITCVTVGTALFVVRLVM